MTDEQLIKRIKEYKIQRQGWKNLKSAYVNYNSYIAESIDKSMRYTEYVAENLSNTLAGGSIQSDISYSEYLTEKIKI
jgi:hypothetical protein